MSSVTPLTINEKQLLEVPEKSILRFYHIVVFSVKINSMPVMVGVFVR